jgi:mannose-6-phosphate isomerase-like protein (cupin superfamily)
VTLLNRGAAVIAAHESSVSIEGNHKYRMPVSHSKGARDIEQTVSVYTGGRAMARRNLESEEVLYVIRGKGQCNIDGHLYEISSGVGVYIPPASIYQIDNTGESELEVVGVSCPRTSIAEAGLALPVAEPSATRPFRTVREELQESIPAGDRTFRLLVSKEIGCKLITQFVGTIPPGRAPMHYHTYEEAIYIIEGEGIVRTEDGLAPFSPGTSVYLPRGVSHCLENTGRRSVRLLGVFHPSGSPGTAYQADHQ